MTGIGSLLGRSERQTIDPEMLKMLFGPQAIGQETQGIYQNLLNSPAFAAMMRSMATQGTALQNGINARVASSGAAGSPIGAFASTVGRGYAGSLQMGGMQDLFMKSLMAAMQNIGQRENLWGQSQLMKQQTPTYGQKLGSAFLAGGAEGLSNWMSKV